MNRMKKIKTILCMSMLCIMTDMHAPVDQEIALLSRLSGATEDKVRTDFSELKTQYEAACASDIYEQEEKFHDWRKGLPFSSFLRLMLFKELLEKSQAEFEQIDRSFYEKSLTSVNNIFAALESQSRSESRDVFINRSMEKVLNDYTFMCDPMSQRSSEAKKLTDIFEKPAKLFVDLESYRRMDNNALLSHLNSVLERNDVQAYNQARETFLSDYGPYSRYMSFAERFNDLYRLYKLKATVISNLIEDIKNRKNLNSDIADADNIFVSHYKQFPAVTFGDEIMFALSDDFLSRFINIIRTEMIDAEMIDQDTLNYRPDLTANADLTIHYKNVTYIGIDKHITQMQKTMTDLPPHRYWAALINAWLSPKSLFAAEIAADVEASAQADAREKAATKEFLDRMDQFMNTKADSAVAADVIRTQAKESASAQAASDNSATVQASDTSAAVAVSETTDTHQTNAAASDESRAIEPTKVLNTLYNKPRNIMAKYGASYNDGDANFLETLVKHVDNDPNANILEFFQDLSADFNFAVQFRLAIIMKEVMNGYNININAHKLSNEDIITKWATLHNSKHKKDVAQAAAASADIVTDQVAQASA